MIRFINWGLSFADIRAQCYASILLRRCIVLGVMLCTNLSGYVFRSLAFADETGEQPQPPIAFLANHCRECHAGTDAEGQFNLQGLSFDFTAETNRQQWMNALRQVQDGSMPPPEQPRPSENELTEFSRWVTACATRALKQQYAEVGRVVLRRLSREEYENTVRDLLGVEVDLSDLLPMESSLDGFDNSAEALHISSYLMDSYLSAADRVLNAAIASGPQPWVINKRFDIKDESSVKSKGSVYRHVDDGVAIFSSWVSANIQVTMWNFQTRFRGQHRFRISAYAYQTDKPVTFHVMAGPMNAAAQQYLIGYYSVPAGKPKVVEFAEQMEPGLTIRIIADGLGALPPDIEKIGSENYAGPGLVIQWVDIEGPILEAWPPESHRRIFNSLERVAIFGPDNSKRFEVVSSDPLVDAERILLTFAGRAFRRSVTADDIRPYLQRVSTQLAGGKSFEQAMRVGLKGILLSPNFLFLQEKPGKLDDFALATRISYFLWSSMPDDELIQLASKGKLNQPQQLRDQVERLLKDPKSTAFTANFVSQWLGLRSIDATLPDGMLYPEYDEVLKVSMLKEVQLFFDEVLSKDLSLTNFTDSDFSVLNGRLAKHYGIFGLEDELDFHKVTLPPDSHRGGLMTMGAILKVTANGTTTSPVVRGAWVLDRILGSPPPKPTVDVEAVEPDIRGATTIREQLAKHRDNSQCASCHAIIDPPGFALENFDVIGGWREHYRSIGEGSPAVVNNRRMRYLMGPQVNASYELADGRSFKDIDEYKKLLLTDKDQLARALAGKLLSYATGATPSIADQASITQMIDNVRDKDYGFRSLIHQIVLSDVFQSK